jgi:N-acetylglucosaminyl-diphospho-decaprenol L-rhamnosyltransferase
MKVIEYSFIIVNYNVKEYVTECIKSIHRNVDSENAIYEIILVDNNSSDGSKELFSNNNGIKYVYNMNNLGFGVANNIGANLARGKVLIFVNPDIQFNSKTNIYEMAKILHSNSNIGMVSCKILFPDGTIQSVGESFPNVLNVLGQSLLFWNYRFLRKHRMRNYKNVGVSVVDWVTGAFILVEKETFVKLGGFDENIFLSAEDIDLAARYRFIGKINVVLDKYEVIHYHGKSRSKISTTSPIRDYKDSLESFKMVIIKNKLSHFPSIMVYLKVMNAILRTSLLKFKKVF